MGPRAVAQRIKGKLGKGHTVKQGQTSKYLHTSYWYVVSGSSTVPIRPELPEISLSSRALRKPAANFLHASQLTSRFLCARRGGLPE